MYISDKGILYVTNWLVYMHLHVQPSVQYCLVGCCLVTKSLIYPVAVSIGRGNGAGVATTARYVATHFLWSREVCCNILFMQTIAKCASSAYLQCTCPCVYCTSVSSLFTSTMIDFS